MGDDGSYMYVYILPVDFYKNIFMTPAILPQKDLCTVNCNFQHARNTDWLYIAPTCVGRPLDFLDLSDRYLQLFVSQLNIRIITMHSVCLQDAKEYMEKIWKKRAQFPLILFKFMAFGWNKKDGVGDDNDTEFGVEFWFR